MEQIVTLVDEINASAITPRRILEEKHHSAIPLLKSLLTHSLFTSEGVVNCDVKNTLELEHRISISLPNTGSPGGLLTAKGLVTFG